MIRPEGCRPNARPTGVQGSMSIVRLRRGPSSRGLRRALLPLVLALGLPGCAPPAPGGEGTLSEDGCHLVVAGSPYEMGWWQGRLLAPAIRALHTAWADAVAARGDTPDRARALRLAVEQYAVLYLARLPEALRQELDGIAEGAGVPARTLLATAALRDGLRFHAGAWRPLAGVLLAEDGGRVAALHPRGEEADLLAGRWILVERRPREGPRTVLLSWPGSLGGLAGAAETGRGFLAAETAGGTEDQQLGAMPFTILARRALERADSAGDLLRRLAPAPTHLVVVVDGPASAGFAGERTLVPPPAVDLAAEGGYARASEAVSGEAPWDAATGSDRARRESAEARRPWCRLEWTGEAMELGLASGGRTPLCTVALPLRR
jgi:hypothetical protein